MCRSEVFSSRTQLISHHGTTKLNKQIHGTTKLWRSWWKLMQQHCSDVLKHDIPGIISCGLRLGANQHKKITDFQNRSLWRFVDGPRWKTKCSAASWSALIACETSCSFSSLKKCCRVTEWKRSEMHYFSRSVSSLLIFKISLEPQYLYNRFLRSKSTSVKPLSVRQVQRSDRINSDRHSGSDQLGSTRTNSGRIKK